MGNTPKTKAQLLEEISVLRSHVAELEAGTGEGQSGKPAPLELESGRVGTKEKPKTRRVIEIQYQTSENRKRTRVEEAIQETEARFYLAFEEGIMAMATFDPSLHIVRVNRAFCEILEYGEKELVGQTLRDITHAEDLEPSFTLMNRMFEGELSNFHVETRFLVKSQTVVWAHMNYTVVRDIEGTPSYVLATIENITERKRAEEALLESNQRYHSLMNDVLDVTNVGLFILDAMFQIVWLNQAITRYFGLRQEDMLGKDTRQLVRERIRNIFEDPDSFSDKVLATYANNTYVENFECHVLPNGEREDRWLEHRSQPIRSGLYAGGRIEHYYDITERKQLELEHQTRSNQIIYQQKVLFELGKRESRTLAEALETFTEVTANTLSVERVSVWLFNDDHSHIVCQDLFKKSEHVHEKEHTLEVAHYPNYFHALEETRVLAAPQTRTDPRTSEFTDRDLRPLGITSFMGVPIRRHGRMFGVICHEHTGQERDWTLDEQEFVASVADLVTLAFENWERTQAETFLKTSQERYAMVMGAVNDGIWDWEIATNYLYLSSTWKKILGYEEQELQNLFDEWATRIHPEDYDQVMASLKNHLDWDHPYDVEHRLRHKNGTYRWILTRGACVRDAQGRPHRMFGSITDITQRKLAEEKVRYTELQLQHSQKLNAIGKLAGGIAHDFNNILGAIIGYTELTLSKVLHEETLRRYLTEVLTAGSRAKELVQQILTFSRQSAGQKKPLHFQLVVQGVLKLIRATLPSTIEIQQQLSASSDLVQADSTQIHQVLMNLCANAEYAMRDQGGVLTIQLETVEEVTADGPKDHLAHIPGPHLLLMVQDTGHGMSPEVLARIFDPFFTTKRAGEGTGMGLAVVHGIIGDHQGRITVTSTPGVGTTVSIVFPLLAVVTTPADIAPDPLEIDAEHPSAAPPKPGHGHVLFVDDEAPLVALGKELLEEFGYEVTTSTSSLDALKAFRAAPSRYDVVVTDQTMPNLSGEALAREILRIRPDIPILLCTGFSHTMTAGKAREVGIRKFLMKPLLCRDLVLALQEAMEDVSTKH